MSKLTGMARLKNNLKSIELHKNSFVAETRILIFYGKFESITYFLNQNI